VRSRKGIYSAAASPTFLLIPSTPSAVSSTTATPTGTENVRVYLVIAVSARVNIVYK